MGIQTKIKLRGWPVIFSSCFFICFTLCAQVKYPDIRKGENSKLIYTSDEKGNRVPDFSHCGYMASEVPIPDVPIKVVVPSREGDATARIQAALDYVGQLKPGKKGIKGAVLLDKGIYSVAGTLYMKHSGVILRGSGNSKGGTVLLGRGKTREPLIRIKGTDNRKYGDTLPVTDAYVPVNAVELNVAGGHKLKTGDRIVIRRQPTSRWIKALNMEEFGGETGWIGWKPESFDISWDREITEIKGNRVRFEVPLTMTLDFAYGPTEVIPYSWPGRIRQTGVENLQMVSEYDTGNKKDEDHRWFGVIIENAEDSWVRQVTFKHFAGGAVKLHATVKRITVEDCKSLEPVSETGGARRYTFYTEGQQTLFQRCYSEYGYHDFAVGGYGTAGPNAFVQCYARLPYNFSGAIGSWASGVLFDVVTIDGDALSLKNREQAGQGAGWGAANSVIWESSASKMECYSPPMSRNWAFGVWGQFSGNGYWKEVNSHISPRSLYYTQLEERLGALPFDPFLMELGTEPSTSPTPEQAEALTALAGKSPMELKEWIDRASFRNPIPAGHQKVKSIDDINRNTDHEQSPSPQKITIMNGRIVSNGKLVTGSRTDVPWWRGSLRKREVERARPHITRFVPGYTGLGYTDNLDEVVEYMKDRNIAAIEHNYGLWYERRRDDHERVRRIDDEVWPPFYEQPFARSGEGEAWDRLSKYDLTRYNHWYWSRLKTFADKAETEGRLLVHQQYFQHNILEAGAHWADSPWRPANNINNTGFPEPPPYAGDKRIFLAKQFYDTTHPVRKKLHKQYIRKGLENFAENTNVIHLTSAEYTGPLHFMQFWLDVIKDWEKETANNALIGLSATKDVQDAILKDPKRSKTVDIIDIRYWHYKEDGSAYAPEGGKHLAPRQHARKMDTGKETAEQVYRAVKEYRQKYPGKAVIYSTHAAGRFGWAVLMAGGSLPAIPEIDLPEFYKALPGMQIADEKGEGPWRLEKPGERYLFCFREKDGIQLDLSNYKGKFEVYRINPDDGEIMEKNTIWGGETRQINALKTGQIVFVIKT